MIDVAQLDVDLRRMIDRARSALDEMHSAEQAVLRNVESTLSELVAARIEAGQGFVDAFGHLVPESQRTGMDAEDVVEPRDEGLLRQLAEDLAHTMSRRGGHGG